MSSKKLGLIVIFMVLAANALILVSCGGSGGGSGSGAVVSGDAEAVSIPKIFDIVPADVMAVISLSVGADFVDNMDKFLAGCSVPVPNPTTKAISDIVDVDFMKNVGDFLEVEDKGIAVDGNILVMFRNIQGSSPIRILEVADSGKVESQLANLGNPEKLEYNNYEYTKTSDRKVAFYSFIGNGLVICKSEDDMKACIDAYTESVQSLSDLDDFRDRSGSLSANVGEATVYVNLARIMTAYGPMIDQQLPMMKQGMARGLNSQGMGQAAAFYMVFIDSVLDMAKQANYASLHIVPKDDDLYVQAGFKFKDGSEFKELLASPDKSYASLNNIAQLGIIDGSFPVDMEFWIRFSRYMADKMAAENPELMQSFSEMMDMVVSTLEGSNLSDGYMTLSLDGPSGQEVMASAYVIKADNPDQIADKWMEMSSSSMKLAAGFMGVPQDSIKIETLGTEEYKGAKIRGFSMESYMQAMAKISGPQAANMDFMPTNAYLASYNGYVISANGKDSSYIHGIIDSLESGKKSNHLNNISEFIPDEGAFMMLISPVGYAQMIQKMVPMMGQMIKVPEMTSDAGDRVAVSVSLEGGDIGARVFVPSSPIGELVKMNKK